MNLFTMGSFSDPVLISLLNDFDVTIRLLSILVYEST